MTMLRGAQLGQVRTIAKECGVDKNQKEKVIKKLEKLDECIITKESTNINAEVSVYNFTNGVIGVEWTSLSEKEEVNKYLMANKMFDTTVVAETEFVIIVDDKSHKYVTQFEKNKNYQHHVYSDHIEIIESNIEPDKYKTTENLEIAGLTGVMLPLTRNFFDAFDKNGQYYCEDMEDYIPPETQDGDDFLVNYYKQRDYQIINAQNLRSGQQFTTVYIGDKINDWFPSDCGRFPTFRMRGFDYQEFIDIKKKVNDTRSTKYIFPWIINNQVSKIWIESSDQGVVGNTKMNGRIKYSDSNGDRIEPIVDYTRVYIDPVRSFTMEVEITVSFIGMAIKIDIMNYDGTMIEIRLRSSDAWSDWIRIGTVAGTLSMNNSGWIGSYV